MGAAAVQRLLEKLNIDPLEIDLIICATVTADMVFPDTATHICHKIKAKNAFGFDINAACSGFLFSLTTASKFIETGTHKKVIVVGADMMSAITNYEDRSTCILFGDAAGAVMLEPGLDNDGIIDSVLHSDGIGRQYLYMKAGGSLHPATEQTVKNGDHFVYQDGRPVFKAAVQGMIASIKEIMERNNLKADDIDWIVPHQANLRIINSVADLLDFPREKVMVNIQKYGNTTSATIPLCLWEWQEKLRKGDKLILTAFGGGYTWGATYVTWSN
jgi:3-oxoacyl-[acyl-carrier-protein] synthase-3